MLLVSLLFAIFALSLITGTGTGMHEKIPRRFDGRHAAYQLLGDKIRPKELSKCERFACNKDAEGCHKFVTETVQLDRHIVLKLLILCDGYTVYKFARVSIILLEKSFYVLLARLRTRCL
jgi:hypothetical protein